MRKRFPRKCYFCRKPITPEKMKTHRCRLYNTDTICTVEKTQTLNNLLDRCVHAKREPFPLSKIFSLSQLIYQSTSDEPERIFLSRRLRSYAYSGRRGNLKLPAKYSRIRAAFSKLSKQQIRDVMYTVRPETSVERPITKSTFDYINGILPKVFWSTIGENLDSCARRVDCHRLTSRDWPRFTRSLWPSSPSFSEMIAMSRRGISPLGLRKISFGFKTHVTYQQINENVNLLTRTVSDNIVGVRSTEPVPRKFLPWFRYRSGFLILTVRYNLPIGLVRFLTSQWIRNPFSLWLKVNCRFKQYLKLVKPPEQSSGGSSLYEDDFESYRYSSGSGSPYSSPSSEALDDDEISFAELLKKRLGE